MHLKWVRLVDEDEEEEEKQQQHEMGELIRRNKYMQEKAFY